ncbi:MAG: GxxExxY protein [Chloroflexi bacterium]|jgi:GxxExxY protein|nr:GxxExxY protein [Chloroflexota bacterium]
MEIDKITKTIIGAAYDVSNTLGVGFLEKVYENALVHASLKTGLNVKQQHRILVHYDGVIVGEYVADMLVNDCVLVEIKAVKALDEIHMAQCLNYLKATGLTLCLLINFGKSRVKIKRIVNNFQELQIHTDARG